MMTDKMFCCFLLLFFFIKGGSGQQKLTVDPSEAERYTVKALRALAAASEDVQQLSSAASWLTALFKKKDVIPV